MYYLAKTSIFDVQSEVKILPVTGQLQAGKLYLHNNNLQDVCKVFTDLPIRAYNEIMGINQGLYSDDLFTVARFGYVELKYPYFNIGLLQIKNRASEHINPLYLGISICKMKDITPNTKSVALSVEGMELEHFSNRQMMDLLRDVLPNNYILCDKLTL